MNQDLAGWTTVVRVNGQYRKFEGLASEKYRQCLADRYILPARQLFIHHHALALLQSLPGLRR